jgi:hypothetical protein
VDSHKENVMRCIHKEPRAYCKRDDGCRDCEDEIKTLEAKLADALARVEEFNIQCKRLLDSSLGSEYSHEGHKIKSARLSLKRLLSLPTIGAADRMLEIARLEAERDDALDRVEELEKAAAIRAKGCTVYPTVNGKGTIGA